MDNPRNGSNIGDPSIKKNNPAMEVRALTEGDFNNSQLDLFRGFVCNPNQLMDLSNTFDLWDSVPRYTVSRQQMDKWRKSGDFPKLLMLSFQHRGMKYKATIQPSWIKVDSDDDILGYYPGANEELVEDALRKIAAEQSNGFFDKPNYRSGVVFTLHMLRKELKKRGHARSYQQIVLSLQILAKSVIEITADNGKKGKKIAVSSYFPGLTAATKDLLENDPEARWAVQFHPLVTQAIDQVTYRQFNYAQMMSYPSQLARWLHKQLSIKFTFASVGSTFEMRYSTIKRDSGFLENYSRTRDGVKVLTEAFQLLKENNVLKLVDYDTKILGPRNQIEDVVYILHPSMDFVRAMKAANKRKLIAEET